MPRNPTPAQSAASRTNARRSTGPTSAEGKARSAQNARTYGLRSAELSFLPTDDRAQFDLLDASIREHFQPANPLEAALCARMVTALWRTERAEDPERNFWTALPEGVRPGHRLTQLHVLTHYLTRPHTLPTILRYLAESDRAFARALRHLEQVRQGIGLPLAEAPDAEAPAAGPIDAPIRTNEPEPCQETPAQGSPANDAAEVTPEPAPSAICTNEPETCQEPPTREASATDAAGADPTAKPATVVSCTNDPENGKERAKTDPNEPEPAPAPAADDLTRELQTLSALDQLAELRRQIAARWPDDADAAEACFLAKHPPTWLADLPCGTPLAGRG